MTTNDPISEGSKNSNGAGCGVVVGLIFALIGFGVLGGAISGTFNVLKVQSWTETPCEILTASMDESDGDDGTSYRADFTFEYKVDGAKFVGDRDRVIKFFGGRKAAKHQLASLPVGTEAVCNVNPEDPADAVLDASFPGWFLGILSVFGLIFGGVGSAVAYASYRTLRADKQKQAEMLGGAGSVSTLAGADDYFQTDVIDRDDDPERRATTTMAAGSLANVRGRGGPTVHPADVEDRTADVPQRLKAQSSRLGTLVAVTLIALFWNGIVSVFLWGVISDGPGGLMTWGVGLFLVPFVLIGLVLIAGVVHSFISLFNPKISVALSSGAVARNGDIDIAWEVSGGIRSIDRLRISVVGTEWARYRRGTDTIVDESTFEIVPVVSTDQAEEISFGSGTVTIPAETMHTMEQTNNKINWAVVVSGSIAWWPNVTGNYPFRVTPHVIGETTKIA